MVDNYGVITIDAGPNRLEIGGYLGKAGRKVLLLDNLADCWLTAGNGDLIGKNR